MSRERCREIFACHDIGTSSAITLGKPLEFTTDCLAGFGNSVVAPRGIIKAKITIDDVVGEEVRIFVAPIQRNRIICSLDALGRNKTISS